MFDKIKCSITYSRIDCAMYTAKNKVKNKVKDEINYAKENPGKTATKVAINCATKAVPGGKVIKTTAKVAGKVAKKVVDKDRVKTIY